MFKPHDAAVYDSTTEVDTAPEHGDHGPSAIIGPNPVLGSGYYYGPTQIEHKNAPVADKGPMAIEHRNAPIRGK